MTRKITLLGVVLCAGGLLPAVVAADVIRLKNGSSIEVEAWRDAGDAIEFAMGGGIVRIGKGEINTIEGSPTRGDLRMYSAPASPPAPRLDRAGAVKQMTDLLKQGEGLTAQTVLSPAEKASAFRKLGEAWRAVEVPDALRDVHAKGQQALQLAVAAFSAEGEGTAPDIKERLEKARTEIRAAQDEVKKAGEAG